MMKRFLSILLLLALLPLCFAACQRTPDEVIVVQKDTERLVEQARAHDGAADAGQALSARLGTPERYRADYAYSDAFSMTADAAVVLPEADRLPTARVVPADFSQETVDRLYAYLVGDTPMYQVPSRRTKASIEAELLEWKRIAGDSGASEEQRAQAQERIEALTAQYADAPETADHEMGSPVIRAQEARDYQSGALQYVYQGVDLAEYPDDTAALRGGRTFAVRQNSAEGEIVRTEDAGGFHVTDTASRGARFSYAHPALLSGALGGASGRSFALGAVTQEEWERAGYGFTGLGPDGAADMARALLAAIGADDMAVGSVELVLHTTLETGYDLQDAAEREAYQAAEQALLDGLYDDRITGVSYTVRCVRQVNGVPVTSDTLSSYLDDAYARQWYYESFTVEVCKDGICAVEWSSPYTVTEIVAEDTALLPFSEVEQVIGRMFRARHDPGPDSAARFAYTVDRIVLSLRRIAEPGGVESGLLVPVWDVYGACESAYPGEPAVTLESAASLLTVNAIDGSVIDLDRGY